MEHQVSSSVVTPPRLHPQTHGRVQDKMRRPQLSVPALNHLGVGGAPEKNTTSQVLPSKT